MPKPSSARAYALQTRAAKDAADHRQRLLDLFRSSPMPDDELHVNLGLYMRSGSLAKILFFDEIYRQILPIPGIVIECGVWRGQTLAILENLRAVHEPYNFARKIVGFDTFHGYAGLSEKDRQSATIKPGGYTVEAGYEKHLASVLECHERENIMSHIKKHELVKGDAARTVPAWLRKNEWATIALAYFDMALYRPTKAALRAIAPRLIRGSVIALDEFCASEYPGETAAVAEVMGLRQHRIFRSRFLPDRSYLIVD